MKMFKFLTSASLLILTFVSHAIAGDRLILRTDPSVVNFVARQHGLKIQKQLRPGEGVYTATPPQGVSIDSVLRTLKANPLVQGAEPDAKVALPEVNFVNKTPLKVPVLHNGAPLVQMSGPSWVAYTNQPAVTMTNLPQAQKKYGQGISSVVVAVIDTSIDLTHPVLVNAVAGEQTANFVDDNGAGAPYPKVAQETTPWVDQETTPWVDSAGTTIILNQETTPWVDQETTPWVDATWSSKIPPALGHGTMAAGLVHLVAPNVKIMAIRAFSDDGSGTIADVVQGIYFAVDHGAQVISMSFSVTSPVKELETAIAYANKRGVICVAVVSNSASAKPVYPAAYKGVIGVAATDNNKVKATFSDWGEDVALASVGVQVISTYPGKKYGVSSGTSFAGPQVAGLAALIKSIDRTAGPAEVAAHIEDGAGPLSPLNKYKLGSGFLDMFQSAILASK